MHGKERAKEKSNQSCQKLYKDHEDADWLLVDDRSDSKREHQLSDDDEDKLPNTVREEHDEEAWEQKGRSELIHTVLVFRYQRIDKDEGRKKVDDEVGQPAPFVASDVEDEVEHYKDTHGHSDYWSYLIYELFVKMLAQAVLILLFSLRLNSISL